MTTRKRIKRQEATAAEHSLNLSMAKEIEVLQDSKNDDLFTIDRGGSKRAKQKIEAENRHQNTTTASKTERALLRKLMAQSKQITAPKDCAEASGPGDLWEIGETSSSAKKSSSSRAQRSQIKRLVVRPGQSYNPSQADHQNLLAEALAIEIEKKEKDAREAGKEDLLTVPEPPSTKLADFGGSESEGDSAVDESEEDTDDKDIHLGTRKSRRKGMKLTIAQRNKLRNRKFQEFEDLKEKREKKLLRDIDRAPEVLKHIEDDVSRAKRKREIKALQKSEDAVDSTSLNYEEAKAVPLSDELHGSLRKITSKGLLINDKVNEMRNSGELIKRDKKRKRYEAPHGPRKVVWIPKYKY